MEEEAKNSKTNYFIKKDISLIVTKYRYFQLI